MIQPLPQSVLFCCDHNAVRSPMAEGLMKKFYGTGTYVQSVGVTNDLEIDGFSIAVCAEMDVELSRHQSRSFDEMEQWGDDLSSFDLVVALSPASQRRAGRQPASQLCRQPACLPAQPAQPAQPSPAIQPTG